jgi:hypothetical protein
MVGRVLLVGVSYLDEVGEVRDQIQFAGVVLAVDPLVTIERSGKDPFTLPPVPDAYDIADPGEYRLRSTGEVVVDPDFVTTWTVRPPER